MSGVKNGINKGALGVGLNAVLLQGGRNVITHDKITDYAFENADKGNIIVGFTDVQYYLEFETLDAPFDIGDSIVLVNGSNSNSINFYFYGIQLVQSEIVNPVVLPVGCTLVLTYLYNNEFDMNVWSLEITSYNAVTLGHDFANDVAAAAGGVQIGGLYHTSGVVKIRLS